MTVSTTRQKIMVAILVGVIVGIIGAFIKFGWEVPFPPRTPLRDATNPPQQLLEQLGMPYAWTHLTYSFNENARPIISFIVHFGFSIVFGVIYCVIAEYTNKIKLWQGAFYGLVIWFVFHIVLLPLFGTVPAPWDQPFAEHFSELFGHMFWTWVMELTRRDLRNRITGLPDAQVGPELPR